MFGMKMAPALAAGCTVVLKSSEKAPLTVCVPLTYDNGLESVELTRRTVR